MMSIGANCILCVECRKCVMHHYLFMATELSCQHECTYMCLASLKVDTLTQMHCQIILPKTSAYPHESCEQLVQSG